MDAPEAGRRLFVAHAGPPQHGGSDTPLVGRAEEISRLTTTIDCVRPGRSRRPHAGIRAEKILARGGTHPLLAIIGGSARIDEAMWLGDAQAVLSALQRTYDLVTVTWSPTFMAVLRLAALCLGAVADQHATDVLAGNHTEACDVGLRGGPSAQTRPAVDEQPTTAVHHRS